MRSYKLLILKHFCIWLGVVVPLKLIGRIVLALVLPFIPKEQEYLPKFVRWFDNAEYWTGADAADGVDGLAGDVPYRIKTGYYEAGYWGRLWLRYDWLARRNAINYFQKLVLGKTFHIPYDVVHTDGDKETGDTRQAGLYRIQLADGLWEWYLIKELSSSLPNSLLRMRLGYKIYDPALLKEGHACQWVFKIGLAKKRY